MKNIKHLNVLFIFFLFSVSSYVFGQDVSNPEIKKISSQFTTKFELDDVTPIVKPILDGLLTTNKKLQDTITTTENLILALNKSGQLTEQQNVELEKAIRNAGEAAIAVKLTLQDRDTILNDFEVRLQRVVDNSGIHGMWKDIRLWVFQIGLGVIIILTLLICFYLQRFIKVIKEVPEDLKIASENLKYIADK